MRCLDWLQASEFAGTTWRFVIPSIEFSIDKVNAYLYTDPSWNMLEINAVDTLVDSLTARA